MFIDVHCHLDSESYDNIDEVISSSLENNVGKLIFNGYNMKSNLEVLNLIKEYDCVYGAIGFHPNDLDDIT